jgi:hypothetical protein
VSWLKALLRKLRRYRMVLLGRRVRRLEAEGVEAWQPKIRRSSDQW